MKLERLNRLYDLLSTSGLNGLALNAGPSLTYLTGLNFHLSERPTVLLLSAGSAPTLVLPELESSKALSSLIPLQTFTYGENPATWKAVFQTACDSLCLNGRTIGVEPTRLRFLELRLLEAAAPQARFSSGEMVLASLRMSKDADEQSTMHKAVEIAQQALLATLPSIHPGISERAIASELTLQLLRAGSESELPFAPIVASGPNSANPHAVPGERLLQIGDLLIIDWGATYRGYCSDLTRTFAIGEVDDELRQIATIVEQANAAGRAAGKPGLPAGQLDAAARSVIEKAGYGEFFTHRTGHGLGMEAHEPPYLFAENFLPLAEGMAYTIEPGIYLPGRGGVRIEDDMVITAQGSQSLSDLPRGLQIL